MTESHPNPLGVDRFEFIEFAAPDSALLHNLFKRLGFTAVARHRSRAVTLYRQGEINFLVNEMPDSRPVLHWLCPARDRPATRP